MENGQKTILYRDEEKIIMFMSMLYLFMIGSLGGWVIELFFRRFVSAKKWINPGFLVGPILPLYGFGLTGMYVATYFLDKIAIENVYLKCIMITLILGILMTLIEYITGLIFIKKMNIKLWDYSDRPLNIQGIICPLFSFFWLVICAVYYLFVHKYVQGIINDINGFKYSLFFIGFFYGVLFVDIVYSFDISSKISKAAKDLNIVVKYEHLKVSISEQMKALKKRASFIFPFKSVKSIKESITNYIKKIENKETKR